MTPAGALRLTENDVEAAFDGGRIVFSLASGALAEVLFDEEKVTGVTAMINFRKDEPMRKFPATRVEREAKRYTLLLVEEP